MALFFKGDYAGAVAQLKVVSDGKSPTARAYFYLACAKAGLVLIGRAAPQVVREPVGTLAIPLGKDSDPSAKARGWIELPQADWPFADQTALFIIQHPKGALMALALDLDAKMEVNANSTRVRYQTGTQPGSSGSPCFNQFWSVVALHHAGDPLYPDLQPGAFNEGIPIGRIVERLKNKGLSDGLTLV